MQVCEKVPELLVRCPSPGVERWHLISYLLSRRLRVPTALRIGMRLQCEDLPDSECSRRTKLYLAGSRGYAPLPQSHRVKLV